MRGWLGPFGGFDALYRRTGARYFDVLLGIIGVLVAAVVIPVYTLFLVALFDIGFRQWLEFALVWEVALGVGAGPGLFVITRRRIPALFAWLRGDRGPEAALAVWTQLVRDVPRTIMAVLGSYALLAVGPVAYVGRTLGFSEGSYVTYYAVILGLIGAMGVVVYLGLEQALRPIVREAAAELAAGAADGISGISLRLKLTALVPSIAFLTAFVVAASAQTDVTPEAYMASMLSLAVLVSLALSLGLALMLRRSLLERVDDIREAMQRVDAGDYDVVVAPLAGDEIDELGRSFNGMVDGLRERLRLREAFGSYVDRDLAGRIAREGSALAGERLDVTVLIVDVRDFTWLAARSEPEDTVAYLNEFFELVIPAVRRHGGHPNKLLGDGLLAAFGAPEPHPAHAEAGVAAAVEILDLVRERYDGELHVGIGVNSGDVVAGTIGGGGKLDYTLIGDPVNVAARLEALTKDVGLPLLVSQVTYDLLGPDSRSQLRSCGVHRLRGRGGELGLFAPTAYFSAAGQAIR